jgi:hypothetical protein
VDERANEHAVTAAIEPQVDHESIRAHTVDRRQQSLREIAKRLRRGVSNLVELRIDGPRVREHGEPPQRLLRITADPQRVRRGGPFARVDPSCLTTPARVGVRQHGLDRAHRPQPHRPLA